MAEIEERVVTADLRYGWVAQTPTMTEEARDDRGEDGTVRVRAEGRRAGLSARAAAVHGAAPDGVRGRGPVRGRPPRAHRGSDEQPEWLPRAPVADPGGGPRVEDPEAAAGHVLPELPRAAQGLGEGAGRRRAGGLPARRQHPEGR